MTITKDEIINTIKLLIYKENPTLLEKVDFEDDSIFLEPLLFAYFNSKKENLFTEDMLKEILQGYFTKPEPLFLANHYNNYGYTFIPKLGYFDNNGTKTEAVLMVDAFEIQKHIHPTQERYFIETQDGHITNSNPIYKSVWKNNYKQLSNAIQIIKQHLPEFYNILFTANKRIFLHDNPKILNFTSIDTLGMLNFYIIGNENLIYFIEELIHQGSHNFFEVYLYNRNDYFKIDVDKTIMRELTQQEWDYRNVYGAFHGLYTVGKRVEYFDVLLSKNLFTGKEKHELLGRLADQFHRFRTGLELLNLEKVYTQKGIDFYNELDNKTFQLLKKYYWLNETFDFSNRESEFRYSLFNELNPYDEFIKKEQQGFFNF
jgi:hypothetical protein